MPADPVNNLLLARIGDGTTTCAPGVGAYCPVFIEEWSVSNILAPSLVQTIALPQAGSGNNRACSAVPDISTGVNYLLMQSLNKQQVTFTCYDLAKSGTLATSTYRVVAQIMWDGSVNTSMYASDLAGSSILTAFTDTGANFWVSCEEDAADAAGCASA